MPMIRFGSRGEAVIKLKSLLAAYGFEPGPIDRIKELCMRDYEFVITNEIITNANNEEELIITFNEKLADLFLLQEKLL